MSFYFNANNSINPTDALTRLIQIFKQSETSKLIKPVETQKNLVQMKISIFQDLKIKLNSLLTIVKDLSLSGTSSKFQVKTADISNPSVLSIVAEPYATQSTHAIFVQQLAKEDSVLSARFSNAGTEILTAVSEGTKTIRIIVNGVSTDVNVAVSSGDTNEMILNKIASNINSTVSNVSATVIRDTSSTSRLVIKSKNTGSQYAISLADVSGNLLESIGLGASVISTRSSSTDVNGGYLYSDVNLLDAKIIVNGVNITRGSNKINDVIPGLTIELKQAQNAGDTPVSVAVKIDSARVRESIDSFVKAYNDLIKFINDKTKTTPEGTRSTFSGDYMLTELKMNLRLKVSEMVSSGTLKFINDIGIKINSDGTLAISDATKLEKLISTDVSQVEALFNSSDGIAVKLKDFINPFVQIGGVVDQRINFGKEQMKHIDERIKSLNSLIDQRAESLRKQFAQLLSLYNAFARQQAMVQQLTQAFVI
ncbi:MAG: flagellar filament capping protein FliD [Candidatus Kryptonium sp.]